MGNDMNTYGSGLRLHPGTDEAEFVALAKELLLADGSLAGSDTAVRFARAETAAAIGAATSLEGLLGAFRQVLVRDASGAVTAMIGVDDRYYDPTPLLAALAPALVDGSWYSCGTDYSGDYVWYVVDGSVERVSLGGRVMDVAGAAENLRWDAIGSLTELPFTPKDGVDTAVTKMARAHTGLDQLIAGVSATRAPEFSWLNVLEGQRALVL